MDHLMQGFNGSTLYVKVKTWDRESHGLYDFESKQVQVSEEYISKPVKL